MEVRHWIGISTMASRKILLPVEPEVTLKVISRSNIDIILKIQHFERRIQRAGSMTLKVTLKVTWVNFGLLFWTLAHIYRSPENGEKSVLECVQVLFLTFARWWTMTYFSELWPTYQKRSKTEINHAWRVLKCYFGRFAVLETSELWPTSKISKRRPQNTSGERLRTRRVLRSLYHDSVLV